MALIALIALMSPPIVVTLWLANRPLERVHPKLIRPLPTQNVDTDD